MSRESGRSVKRHFEGHLPLPMRAGKDSGAENAVRDICQFFVFSIVPPIKAIGTAIMQVKYSNLSKFESN